ncbi:MAG: DNA repair protein RecO C-terminal domain-containing protein [Flavobacteriales bacterium]
MLQTTRAVMLKTVRHGDRSVVLKAYTEAFGARSYMLRAARRGRSSVIPQALDRLELVVTEDARHEMHTIREWRVELPYLRVRSEHARGLLLLFAQEVLYRTLREEVQDHDLFELVQRTLEQIDSSDDLTHLPLFLLLRLSGQLGFQPELPIGNGEHFDLREGRFIVGRPAHGFCMDGGSSRAFAELMRADAVGDTPLLHASDRKLLLEHLLAYFRLHVEGFGQLRSPEVIHAVLH